MDSQSSRRVQKPVLLLQPRAGHTLQAQPDSTVLPECAAELLLCWGTADHWRLNSLDRGTLVPVSRFSARALPDSRRANSRLDKSAGFSRTAPPAAVVMLLSPRLPSHSSSTPMWRIPSFLLLLPIATKPMQGGNKCLIYWAKMSPFWEKSKPQTLICIS